MSEARIEFKTVEGKVVRAYDDYVEISVEGKKGILLNGLAGAKVYYYNDITSVQFKNCGWTPGFMEFTMAGGTDSEGGAFSGIMNDNRITFGAPTIGKAKKVAVEAEALYEFIQERMKVAKSSGSGTIVQEASAADEIAKFKKLLDDGIITEEEFSAKKRQLLNID